MHLPEEQANKQIHDFNSRKIEDLKRMKKEEKKRRKWYNKEISRLKKRNESINLPKGDKK